jgi:hypothetical protein
METFVKMVGVMAEIQAGNLLNMSELLPFEQTSLGHSNLFLTILS